MTEDNEKKLCPFMSTRGFPNECIENKCMAWKVETYYINGYCKLIQR